MTNKNVEGKIVEANTFNFKYKEKDTTAYDIKLDNGEQFVVFKKTLHDFCKLGNLITAELKPPTKEGQSPIADVLIVKKFAIQTAGEPEPQPITEPKLVEPQKLVNPKALFTDSLREVEEVLKQYSEEKFSSEDKQKMICTLFITKVQLAK